MSGGKGGSTSSTVTIPQYIEDAAKANLAKAEEISKNRLHAVLWPRRCRVYSDAAGRLSKHSRNGWRIWFGFAIVTGRHYGRNARSNYICRRRSGLLIGPNV